MSSTCESLQKLADKLDETSFQRAYRSSRYDTYGKRRAFIASYLWECQLRRYFDDTKGVNNCTTANDTASYAKDPTIQFWLDEVRYPADCARHAKQPLPVHVPGCPIPIPSPEYLAEWQASQLPKEDTMTKPITITTTTFVNGADISKMADSEVFDLIASEETIIEGLKKIKAQPKKLVAEIAKREAGIAALVAYLDSKEG